MKLKNTIKESRTDWERLNQMSDSDIDVSDIPSLDKSFFNRAKLRNPKRKQAVSVRLDKDVFDWFRRKGKGYQNRINAVLRAYVETHK